MVIQMILPEPFTVRRVHGTSIPVHLVHIRPLVILLDYHPLIRPVFKFKIFVLVSDWTKAFENLRKCNPCPQGKYCQEGKIQGPCTGGFLCISGADAPNPAYGQDDNGDDIVITPYLNDKGRVFTFSNIFIIFSMRRK